MLDDLSRDYAVYGEALLSSGLEVRDAIDGVGLVTRGLIWHCPQIWLDATPYFGTTGTTVITSWARSTMFPSGVTTTWLGSTFFAGSSTVTGWSPPPKGYWSEC